MAVVTAWPIMLGPSYQMPSPTEWILALVFNSKNHIAFAISLCSETQRWTDRRNVKRGCGTALNSYRWNRFFLKRLGISAFMHFQTDNWGLLTQQREHILYVFLWLVSCRYCAKGLLTRTRPFWVLTICNQPTIPNDRLSLKLCQYFQLWHFAPAMN